VVYCNRGANGIDGVLSTAMGNSVAHSEFCTLIGDIAFLHDASSLVNHRLYDGNHTVVIINNNGGHIFDMLPIAKMDKEILTPFYTTPQVFEARFLAQVFGISFAQVQSKKELIEVLNQSYSGMRIIECKTDAQASMQQRQAFLKA
jgi:2-succinyl-5-enolpyruvyl-6-hydroxy-3-cyclohexene-1-carboxylate synthase